jgi:DNA invertase Pin-like site-specific DNA recombinase
MNPAELATKGADTKHPGGRPRRQVDVEQVKRLRAQGHSWREIARQLRLGYGTVYEAVQPRTTRKEVIENCTAEAL